MIIYIYTKVSLRLITIMLVVLTPLFFIFFAVMMLRSKSKSINRPTNYCLNNDFMKQAQIERARLAQYLPQAPSPGCT